MARHLRQVVADQRRDWRRTPSPWRGCRDTRPTAASSARAGTRRRSARRESCVRPRFCRCWVTVVPTVVSVTFDTGSLMRLSNQVARHVRLRDRLDADAQLRRRPAARARAGCWPASSTVPTRNWRYSSLSVGARKPQPRSPHTLNQLGEVVARRDARAGHVSSRSGSVGGVVGGRRAARHVVSRLWPS